jgi:hypothetical protein
MHLDQSTDDVASMRSGRPQGLISPRPSHLTSAGWALFAIRIGATIFASTALQPRSVHAAPTSRKSKHFSMGWLSAVMRQAPSSTRLVDHGRRPSQTTRGSARPGALPAPAKARDRPYGNIARRRKSRRPTCGRAAAWEEIPDRRIL